MQQALNARLLGLFSTENWSLSYDSERVVLAEIHSIKLVNNNRRCDARFEAMQMKVSLLTLSHALKTGGQLITT